MESFKELVRLLLFYVFCIVISAIFSSIYLMVLHHLFHLTPDITFHEKMRVAVNYYGSFSILFFSLAVPLFEETVFRLWLSLKRNHLLIALFFIIFRATGPSIFKSNFFDVTIYVRISAAVLLVVGINKAVTPKLLTGLKNQYRYLFYFSAIAFGLLHVANFSPTGFTQVLLFSLLTLPQFIMGLFLAYVRIYFKNGFLLAVLFHGLINLPTSLSSLF